MQRSKSGIEGRTARSRGRIRRRNGGRRMRRHGSRRRLGRRGGLERTCCLSHTGRTTGLRVGSVGLRWARQVILVVCRRASRRWVQAVLGLGSVGRGNIGGSGLGLRRVRVLRVGAYFRLRGVSVVSGSSSRGLVCRMFRMMIRMAAVRGRWWWLSWWWVVRT